MSRIAYVNGQYVPHAHGAVHIEDRGFQFADSVYDAFMVRDGQLLDQGPHLNRLDRSMAKLQITPPVGRAALEVIIGEIIRRNHIRNGFVYIQVTRGAAPRNHPFPTPSVPASLILSGRAIDLSQLDRLADVGVSVITTLDIRWQRCDIKSTGLLPNVLAKQAAKEAGAFEAWFVDGDGWITEGSSTNAWIVSPDGDVLTRSLDGSILGGITRETLITAAKEAGRGVKERPFSVEEAKGAEEAFITSASNLVMPVISIDGQKIGSGKPGPIAKALRAAYMDHFGFSV
jgi:D-alanine transaminase